MEIDKQIKIIKRGIVDFITEDELRTKLKNSQKKGLPLRVKAGFDPSAPDIHLGHSVLLRKLHQFQELGHMVYFLIGDFTACIGDPSGQTEKRKQLSKKEVQKNSKTYERQIFKMLIPDKTKIVFNSSWYGKMKFENILELSSKYTIAKMLERDDFSQRHRQDKPISILEFLYPLFQAYDSVVIKSDIEIGGTDQKFNLLVAREIQRDYKISPQVIITLPILEGLDGKKKMSKSIGNYIGIEEAPKQMFGKLMSISDSIMKKYFELLTDVNIEKIDELHPKQAKIKLAKSIVSFYYNNKEAEKQAEEFNRVFRDKLEPTQIKKVIINGKELKNGKIWTVKLLKLINFAKTNSEAKRLIQQGGVRINDIKISDEYESIEIKDGMLIKVGKLKFAKILCKKKT